MTNKLEIGVYESIPLNRLVIVELGEINIFNDDFYWFTPQEGNPKIARTYGAFIGGDMKNKGIQECVIWPSLPNLKSTLPDPNVLEDISLGIEHILGKNCNIRIKKKYMKKNDK